MNKTSDFNDDLSDMLGGAAAPAPKVDRAPDWYKDKQKDLHIEACPKCGGRGRFISYAGRDIGPCFTCKGAGKRTFKSSSADRAKSREQSALRKATNEAARVVAFKTEHATVWAWLESNPNFEFASSLRNAIAKYGYLTEKQFAAVERLMQRDADRATERKARVDSAPVVETAGIDRLKAAFDLAVKNAEAKARGNTIRNPKITVGGMTISPAKATSKNPGALYVKGNGEYLGKIADGKFFASRECTPEQQAQVLKFVADPAEAAKAYGQETGVCCICNATLRSEWRLRGIGPICAEKFGW